MLENIEKLDSLVIALSLRPSSLLMLQCDLSSLMLIVQSIEFTFATDKETDNEEVASEPQEYYTTFPDDSGYEASSFFPNA